MATTPNADQRVARQQLRQLLDYRQSLKDEKRKLQQASLRIADIDDELPIVNTQIDMLRSRIPPDDPQPDASMLKAL